MKDGGGNIIGFKDHSGSGRNANIQLYHEYVKMSELKSKNGYSADFKNSLYKVPGGDLAVRQSSYSTLIFTFKITKLPISREYIICDLKADRAITVHNDKLQIWGTTSDPLEVKYRLNIWNTVSVQWTFTDDEMKGYLYFLNKLTTFTTVKVQSTSLDSDVFIGAKHDGTSPLSSGSLTGLEIYTSRDPPENMLPEAIRNLLIEDQENMVIIPSKNQQWRARRRGEPMKLQLHNIQKKIFYER